MLTDARTWLKVQSTRVVVSSSEQVRAAPVCAAPDFRTLSIHSAAHSPLPLHFASAPCLRNAQMSAPTSVHFTIPNVLPSQTVSQVSLSHNVTAVPLPKHRFFAMHPADIEEAIERCAPPFSFPSPLHHSSHAEPLAELLLHTSPPRPIILTFLPQHHRIQHVS